MSFIDVQGVSKSFALKGGVRHVLEDINLTVERRVFYPSVLGKFSTGSQLATVALVLLVNATGVGAPLLPYVFGVTLVLTVVSALHYVYKASTRRATQEAR